MLTIEDTVTVEDIDQAITHITAMLVDRYGNRLSYHRRELLKSSIDDLLDARLALTVKSSQEGN
jgi:hypothetical protein